MLYGINIYLFSESAVRKPFAKGLQAIFSWVICDRKDMSIIQTHCNYFILNLLYSS